MGVARLGALLAVCITEVGMLTAFVRTPLVRLAPRHWFTSLYLVGRVRMRVLESPAATRECIVLLLATLLCLVATSLGDENVCTRLVRFVYHV